MNSTALQHRPTSSTARCGAMHVVLCIALLHCSQWAVAQQDPAYALYMWNMLMVNPAHAGTGDRLNATLIGRQQWVGLDGAPSTQSLAVHAPLHSHTVALGGSMVRDKVGPTEQLRVAADFAYRIRTSGTMRLALGLKAGVEWWQMNMSEVPDVAENDPIFQQDRRSGTRPNFGFGAYWWSEKGFVAFSVPRLLEQDAVITDSPGGSLTMGKQQRTYMLSAGRVFALSSDVKLQTWAMAKGTLHAPVSIDATLALLLRDRLWIGGSYHGTGTVAALLAYRFMDRLSMGYAYGASIGGLRSRNDGTHELLIGYDLPLRGDRTLSPRYF